MKFIRMKILRKWKSYSLKRKYEPLIPMVISGLEKGLTFTTICSFYDIEAKSLDHFLSICECYQFKRLNTTQTLRLTQDIKNFIQKFKQNIIKEFSYPVILMIISLVLLYFYGFNFGPSVLGMISQFSSGIKSIQISVFIAKLLSLVGTVLVMVIMSASLILRSKDMRILLYTLIHRIAAFSVVKESISLMFAQCFLFLSKLEITTYDTIMELRNMSHLHFVSWLSYFVDEDLKEGLNTIAIFKSDYFSKLFSMMVTQGLIGDDLNSNIEEYLQLATLSIELKIKTIGKVCKAVAYFIIVLIIALFYSSLFAPLKMMEGLI